MDLVCYTDGGCNPNPGIGAWAYVVFDESMNIVDKGSGIENNTTNNRMEYKALIEAKKKHGSLVSEYYSDSQLLVDTVTKWRFSWKSVGWRKKRNKNNDIKNLDLVQELDSLFGNDVNVFWIRGHAGHFGNEYVDQMIIDLIGRSEMFSTNSLIMNQSRL